MAAMASSFLDEQALSRLAGYDLRIREPGTVIRDDDLGRELELSESQAIVQGRVVWVTPRMAENIKEACRG